MSTTPDGPSTPDATRLPVSGDAGHPHDAAYIRLPWPKPPLSLNDRGYTRGAAMAKAATIADIQNTIHTLAKHAHLPKNIRHVTVQLHYQPPTNHRRDTDNLIATLKPICDALAGGSKRRPGYGMVPDDIPAYMSKPEPILHPKIKGQPGRMWLVLNWTNETEAS